MVVFENVISSMAERWVSGHNQPSRKWQVIPKPGSKPQQAAIVLEPYEKESTTVLHFVLSGTPVSMILDGTKISSAATPRAACEIIVRFWLFSTQQHHRHFEISEDPGIPGNYIIELSGSLGRSAGKFTVYTKQVLSEWLGMPSLWVASFVSFQIQQLAQQHHPVAVIGDRPLAEVEILKQLAELEKGSVWSPFPSDVSGYYWLLPQEIETQLWSKPLYPLLQEAREKQTGLLCYVYRFHGQVEIIIGFSGVGPFVTYKTSDDWRQIGFVSDYHTAPLHLTAGPLWLKLGEYLAELSTRQPLSVPLLNKSGLVQQWSGTDFLQKLQQHRRAR